MSSNKIKKQIEFYFSDANFRVDAFLKQQSLINNGYIPIKTILTFKKMRELNATEESVIESIKDSKVVELKDGCLKKIETNEFKSYICCKDIDSKCLYISGIDKNMELEEIENLLKQHMTPLLIRMRREKNKKFSGSIFVELKSEEEVENVLKSDDLPKNLKFMKKTEFLEKKEELSEDKKIKEAKEALKSDFLNKLFKYESESTFSDIAAIKNIVNDVAFVDLNEKVIRLKFAKDFDDKVYEKDTMKIKLTKLNKSEVEEYCNKIPVNIKKKEKGKKRKNNKKENAINVERQNDKSDKKIENEVLIKRQNETEEKVKKIKNDN